MNVLLRLFLTFAKIGLFTFGGGYAMIPLIRDECLANEWLTEEELLNFIAVSESTPGPVAVNMATFVGSSQAGILGSLCATVGVILPSFIIILLIVAVLKNVLKYAGVRATLSGVRPVVVGLILGTAAVMFLRQLFGISAFGSAVSFDWRAVVIFALLTLVTVLYTRLRKRKISPIFLILFAGVAGVIFYL